MCEPTSILMIAGMTASLVGQQQQADAVESRMLDSYDLKVSQLKKSAAQEKFNLGNKARAEQSRIRAATGESGLEGNSVATQLLNSMFAQGQNEAAVDYNLNQALQDTQSSLSTGLAQIKQPNYLATGLMIGAEGMKGYESWQANSDPFAGFDSPQYVDPGAFRGGERYA